MNCFKFSLGSECFVIRDNSICSFVPETVRISLDETGGFYNGKYYNIGDVSKDKFSYLYDVDEEDMFASADQAELELLNRCFSDFRKNWLNSDIKNLYEKHFKEHLKLPSNVDNKVEYKEV